jgi:DNA-binding CsgD family transcriptional regulator
MKKTRSSSRGREGYHWFRGWTRPSEAQRRVLDELVLGGTTSEIATRLGISEDGVKWHLSQLRDELGLEDRRALAEWWLEKRRQNEMLPLVAAWRLLASKPAIAIGTLAFVAAAVSLAWLAYSSLDTDGSRTSPVLSAAAPTTGPAPAPIAPTPTETPVAGGALVFDLDSGSFTPLPGLLSARRWLNAADMTFVANSPAGELALIDAEGWLRPIPTDAGTEFSAYYPLPEADQVVVWQPEAGKLSIVDTGTGQARTVSDFGYAQPGRRGWAIAPHSGRIALTDMSSIRSYAFGGDDEHLVFEASPEEAVVNMEWSPDGRKLLVLLGSRQGERISPSARFVVLDETGATLTEGEVAARWAGSDALLVIEDRGQPAGAGRFHGDPLLDLRTGEQVTIAEPKNLLCVSPDGKNGVYVYEKATANTSGQRQEIRSLQTNVLVARSESEQAFYNCDWTPDGRRVVLSPGGK